MHLSQHLRLLPARAAVPPCAVPACATAKLHTFCHARNACAALLESDAMATTGRKPKPVEQKIRTGNPGKRKLPALASVQTLPVVDRSVPEPHRPLMKNANGGLGPGMQLWQMIWESGSPWLHRQCDRELILLVCEQTDERAILRDRMFRKGMEWRDRAALRMLEKQIAQNLAQLGFTPTDRARFGTSSEQSDALQEFRNRVAAKRAQS